MIYTTELMTTISLPRRLFGMDDYKKISGARIRQAREDAGIDQAELARRIGVEPSAVGNYEQGTRYPKPPYLSKLAQVLKKPVGWLSGLETDKRVESLQLLYSLSDSRGKDTIISIAESQSARYVPGSDNGKTGT